MRPANPVPGHGALMISYATGGIDYAHDRINWNLATGDQIRGPDKNGMFYSPDGSSPSVSTLSEADPFFFSLNREGGERESP